MTRAQRCAAEFAGTALLLAIVIGSGIMGERLAAGNTAVALLANTLATVAGLFVLIEVFGPLSGAHFNPLVSAVMTWRGELPRRELPLYVLAQLARAVLGAWLAQSMFELPFPQWSTRLRGGGGQWLAEAVATAGLIVVILRAPAGRASALVAAWIGAAYWFTASTAFANPAAAFGRLWSDTVAGIAAVSVPGFMLAQCGGAVLGLLLHRALGGACRRYRPTFESETPRSRASAEYSTSSGPKGRSNSSLCEGVPSERRCRVRVE